MPHRPSDTPRADDELPAPTSAEREHGEALAKRMRAAIEAGAGAIDFSRFMELALYEPGLGYYSAGRQKFGAGGDFVTAPELGPVFARCLARQCQEILGQIGDADILEVGAGSGILAADLLAELARLGSLPPTYFILELSGELRARQAETIRRRIPPLHTRVHWLDALPTAGFRGIVLANEVLDAMPVERFRVGAGGIAQLQVGLRNGNFAWRERPADAALAERIAPLGLPPGYVSEVGLQAEAWTRTVAAAVERGVVLVIDYGFPRAEFYHPQRSTGTLMCHYRHRAHGDPLVLVGMQDITAHVDVTAIADAAGEAGLELLGYASQAAFLLNSGLEQIVSASIPDAPRRHLELTAQIKRLTLPSEMGELYKVLAVGRGVAMPLLGFRQQDRRGRL